MICDRMHRPVTCRALALLLAGGVWIGALNSGPAEARASLTPDAVVTGILSAPAPQQGDVGTCERGNPQYLPDTPLAFPLLGIERANQISTGEGVKVAVVDSGVDAANTHLTAVTAPGTDFVSAGGNGNTDAEGHGTAIAGIIAAQPVDGSGLVGVAPDAEILPVRVYEATSSLGPGTNPIPPTPEATAAGIRWAASQGAQIIVVALSTPVDSPDLAGAVADALAAGSLVVASAGNRATANEGEAGDGVRYPAGYDGVLSVTAVDNAGAPTEASIHGPHVSVAAPGQHVLVSWFADGDCFVSQDAPSSSFATAYVGGIAALVAASHPDESPEMWRWRIESTALRSSASDRDDLVGWGIVAPYDAVTVIPSAQLPGPLMPGGIREPAPGHAGQVPPEAAANPLAVRAETALIVTGAGVLVVSVLWLVRRARELRGRR